MLSVIFCHFLVVFEGPGLFREVRGTGRIRFHSVSSKSDHGRPRNKQKQVQTDRAQTDRVQTDRVQTDFSILVEISGKF